MAQNDVDMFSMQDVNAEVSRISGKGAVDASRFGEGLDMPAPELEPAQDRSDLWPTDEESPAPAPEPLPLSQFWADLEPADIEKAKNLEAHATKKYQQIAEKERELAAREAELAQRNQFQQQYTPPQTPYGYQPQFVQAPPQPQEIEAPLPAWAKTDEEFSMMGPEAQEAYRGRLEDHYERWEMKQDFQDEKRVREQRELAEASQKIMDDYNNLPPDKPPLNQILQVADSIGLRLTSKNAVARAYREFKDPLNVQHLVQATAPGRTTIASQRLPLPSLPVQSESQATRPTIPSPEPEGGGSVPGKRISVDQKGIPIPFEKVIARSLRSRGIGVDEDEVFGG